jgi:hypothetical protein
MFSKKAVLARIDALPMLPTIPAAAKAFGYTEYQMRGLVDAGIVKTIPTSAGTVMRLSRQALRELAEQHA